MFYAKFFLEEEKDEGWAFIWDCLQILSPDRIESLKCEKFEAQGIKVNYRRNSLNSLQE